MARWIYRRLTSAHSPNEFYEIMDMLDKRLNDKGKNWRHVLKSLKVLDYCLHEGSELVVTWARKNVYIIKTLREFQYVDEESRDVGQNGKLFSSSFLTVVLTMAQFVWPQRNSPRSFWTRIACAVNDLTGSFGRLVSADLTKDRALATSLHAGSDEDARVPTKMIPNTV